MSVASLSRPEDTVLLCSSLTPASYNSSTHCAAVVHETFRVGGCDINVPFVTKQSLSFIRYTWTSCEFPF